MKPEEDFKEYYDNVLAKKVAKLDDYRIKTWNRLIGYQIAFGILFLILLFLIAPAIGSVFSIVVGALFFGCVYYVYNLVRRWLTDVYADALREDVVPDLLKFFKFNLEYDPDEFINEKAFEISGLFAGYDSAAYIGSDYMEGYIGDTNIRLSQLRTITPFLGRVIFNGLFLIADFNKNFDYELVILSRESLNAEDKLTYGFHFEDFRPVLLENPEFSRHFKVFGQEQVEARYILSPNLMQRMIDLREKLGTPVQFSFARSFIFIAINIKGDIFKLPLSRPTTYIDILLWHDYLKTVFGIVDELNLNKRIWSKMV